MDEAQHHGADEHHHAVGHGIEQGRQYAPAFAQIQDYAYLLQSVSEEAAGKGAHDKGGNTAVEQQLAEGQSASSGLYLLHCHQRCDYHDEAVAHVRHHQPVEQDEEGGHKGVGVQTAVGRQTVHVGDHVQCVGNFIVFELYRDLRVFALLRHQGLPGAAEVLEYLYQLRFSLLRDPAFHHHGGLGAVELLVCLGQSYLGADTVGGQLQLVPAHRLGPDVLHAAGLLLGQLRELLLGLEYALLCGAVHAAQIAGAEGKASQAVLHGGYLFLHCHKEDISVPLVLIDLEKLALLVNGLYGRLDLAQVRLGGYGAHEHSAALRPLSVQGKVKPLPGLEALYNAALTALLGADALDAGVVALDGLSDAQGSGEPGVVQEDQVFQFRLCRQQLLLFGSICIQQDDGVVETCILGFESCHITALPTDEVFQLGTLDLSFQLRKLNTAVANQLSQQLVLFGSDSHEPELFHF